MSWDMAPEAISTVVLCIIWVYSRKGNLIPSLRNRLFQVSLLTTFCAMTSNILSAVLIFTLNPYTLVLTWVVTLIYFITTPLMGMVYFFYVMANIYEDNAEIRRDFFFASIPGVAYVILVLLSPINHCIFSITPERGYSQGPLISTTYIIFFLYCAACVLLVAWRGKRVAPAIRAILFTFPLIAALVIVIQMVHPSTVLSGSAATCALLIIYLYLQNKQIGIDYLTKLPNRREFLRMMELYLRKKYNFTTLVISLREFKAVNDTHGQHNGDALLAAFSEFLRRGLGLGEGDIYRYSGDEFALLIKDAKKPEMEALVEKLRIRMKQPWEAGDRSCLLTVAIGLVSFPHTAQQMEGLINGLEYAVSAAKRDGENRNLCYCTPELLEKSKRHHQIEKLLEQNLAQGGFEVYYQPIYSVEDGSFRKAEALLRMRDPDLGNIPPSEFIPIAEESGLIVEITYLVLKKVCAQIRQLLDEGLSPESINVNLSALQFAQKDLLPRMLEIIADSGIPVAKVGVELTESTLAENAELIEETLRQMHREGIHIGLDDFGTGYSNLISVLDLPIDTVKMDKSLVWAAMKSERFAIAMQNFSRAFRELGMCVLAEGVETGEQSSFVVECGCAMIQGFLYAKPMPAEEYRAFLESRAGLQKEKRTPTS